MSVSPSMVEERYMKLAIGAAHEGITKGQSPFGACIVKGNEILVVCHNIVVATTDISAHAEMVAIRRACNLLKTVNLTGYEIYSTCEPCPMCFALLHWAKVDRVIYGSNLATAERAGFKGLSLSSEHMKREGKSNIDLTGGVLIDECLQLFHRYNEEIKDKPY